MGRRWAPGRAVLVALALLAVAGCGRPGASASTHAPAPTQVPTAAGSGSAAATGPLAFAACVRSLGVPAFPDPSGGAMLMGNKNGEVTVNGVALREGAAQVQTADTACRSYMQASATSGAANPTMQQAADALAQCMRAHGVAGFPDPQISGGHALMQIPSGTDPNSPQFPSAQAACQTLMTSVLPAAPPATGGNG